MTAHDREINDHGPTAMSLLQMSKKNPYQAAEAMARLKQQGITSDQIKSEDGKKHDNLEHRHTNTQESPFTQKHSLEHEGLWMHDDHNDHPEHLIPGSVTAKPWKV